MNNIVKFQNCTNDIVFKKAFGDALGMSYLLKAFYEYVNKKSIYKILKKLEPEKIIMSEGIKKKVYYNDLYVRCETGEIIGLEMYSGSINEYKIRKSYSYMERLIINQIDKKNTKYEIKPVTMIVFGYGSMKEKLPYFINEYQFKHDLTDKTLGTFTGTMYVVRLDYEKTQYYDDDATFVKIINFMKAKSLKEMKEYSKEENEMKEIYERVMAFLGSDKYRAKEEMKRGYYNDGYNEGEARGQELIAKKMLKNKEPISKIMKYTGLTKQQIMML